MAPYGNIILKKGIIVKEEPAKQKKMDDMEAGTTEEVVEEDNDSYTYDVAPSIGNQTRQNMGAMALYDALWPV